MGEINRLKVLHVASGDLWAGAEVQLLTLVSALHARPDTAVSVVLFNYGRLREELHNAGIKVTVIDEARLNSIKVLGQLIRCLKEQAPDVIHTHRIKENILGSVAAYFTGKIPCMRTVHGAPEHYPSWWKLPKRIIYMLDRFCGRHLQRRIVAVSEDMATILNKDFPADRICVIENGIDLDAIQKGSMSPGSPGMRQGTFRVGLAGRLVPVKRVDIFIQTAQYLANNYPDVAANFHIYGDGPMRSELERFSQQAGTGNIVSFEGQSDDMLQDLQRLDVLMMTSDHEGLPMILLEAIALQIPVIAHAVGGIPKLLDHGNGGILVHEQNCAAYAEEIYKLSGNPEIQSRLVKNALRHVEKNNTSTWNASSYYAVYSAVTLDKATGVC